MIQEDIKTFRRFLKGRGWLYKYNMAYTDALNTWHMETPLRIFLDRVAPLMAIRAAFRWDNDTDMEKWKDLNTEWEQYCFNSGIVAAGKGWANVEYSFYHKACNIVYGFENQAFEQKIPNSKEDKLRIGSLNIARFTKKGLLPEVLAEKDLETAKRFFYEIPSSEKPEATEILTVTSITERRGMKIADGFSITNNKYTHRITIGCNISKIAMEMGYTKLRFARSTRGTIYLILTNDPKDSINPAPSTKVNLVYNCLKMIQHMSKDLAVTENCYKKFKLGSAIRTENKGALIYKVLD